MRFHLGALKHILAIISHLTYNPIHQSQKPEETTNSIVLAADWQPYSVVWAVALVLLFCPSQPRLFLDYESLCFHSHSLTQDGDSAVIRAVLECQVATLRELVRAGSDVNLTNKVTPTLFKGLCKCLQKLFTQLHILS